MFCGNCGKELTGAPKKCSSCGARPVFSTHFCPECGAQTTLTEVCVRCGAKVGKEASGYISPKSRLAVGLLAWFLGIFGAHRFYVGKTRTAIVMLLLGIAGFVTTYGIYVSAVGAMCLLTVGIWALIDFVSAVTGRMRDSQGRLIQNR